MVNLTEWRGRQHFPKKNKHEKSPTRFYKDYIPFIHFSDDLYDDFIEPFRNVFTESGWDEYKKQIERDRFKGKKMR